RLDVRSDNGILRCPLLNISHGAPTDLHSFPTRRSSDLSGGRFTYVPAVSRPSDQRNAGFEGERGRLTAIAARHAEAFALDATSSCEYACYHPAMVAPVQAHFVTDTQPVRDAAFFKAGANPRG